MRRASLRLLSRDQGSTVIVFTAIILAVFFMTTAFAVDVARTITKKRQIQFASDAGGLAGVDLFKDLATYPQSTEAERAAAAQAAIDRAVLIANPNELPISQITLVGGIKVGQVLKDPDTDIYEWSEKTAPFDAPVNALLVPGRATVPTRFANLFGFAALYPGVDSVSFVEMEYECTKPFGFPSDHLSGVSVGDHIFINKNDPGNWGKITDGLNGSGAFYDAMINDTCSPLPVGEDIPVSTGFAGVENAFNALLGTEIVLAVVEGDEFPDGNSDTVVIESFVRVVVESVAGNGGNFIIEFIVQEFPVDPDSLLEFGDRQLFR